MKSPTMFLGDFLMLLDFVNKSPLDISNFILDLSIISSINGFKRSIS